MSDRPRLVSGWRLGRWLRPRRYPWRFWRWVRVTPGLFWLYDDDIGWLHLRYGYGGLCTTQQALIETELAGLPFRMVTSYTGEQLFLWRFQ